MEIVEGNEKKIFVSPLLLYSYFSLEASSFPRIKEQSTDPSSGAFMTTISTMVKRKSQKTEEALKRFTKNQHAL